MPEVVLTSFIVGYLMHIASSRVRHSY